MRLIGEDVIHPHPEFHELDLSQLDPDLCGSHWTLSRGGHGFGAEDWSITVTTGEGRDTRWDVWQLPPALSAAMNLIAKVNEAKGRDGVRDAILGALGL